MRLKREVLYVILILLVILFIFVYFSPQLLPSPGVDSPPTFHQFYGNVSYANGSLLKNVEVYAMSGNTKLTSQISANGVYGNTSSTLFIVENLVNGERIDFYVNKSGSSQKVASTTFAHMGLTKLNLLFYYCGDASCNNGESCSSCSADCEVCQNECSAGQTRCSDGVCKDSCNTNNPGNGGGAGSCTATCTSLNYSCGNQIICGTSKNCGSCGSGKTCQSGKCIVIVNNTASGSVAENVTVESVEAENPDSTSYPWTYIVLIGTAVFIIAIFYFFLRGGDEMPKKSSLTSEKK